MEYIPDSIINKYSYELQKNITFDFCNIDYSEPYNFRLYNFDLLNERKSLEVVDRIETNKKLLNEKERRKIYIYNEQLLEINKNYNCILLNNSYNTKNYYLCIKKPEFIMEKFKEELLISL